LPVVDSFLLLVDLSSKKNEKRKARLKLVCHLWRRRHIYRASAVRREEELLVCGQLIQNLHRACRFLLSSQNFADSVDLSKESGMVNFLLMGPGDVRHTLQTLCLHTRRADHENRKLGFYVHE
jgi:hypothetical protein